MAASFSQITMGATPPVPEPSEYLMMLAGLGIVGYAVRRRRQD
ncbi:MAG: PEPxxWA-CTERM sorting domain-containing protein [Chitinivorax sp.]